MKKRILSMILVLAVLLSLMQITAANYNPSITEDFNHNIHKELGDFVITGHGSFSNARMSSNVLSLSGDSLGDTALEVSLKPGISSTSQSGQLPCIRASERHKYKYHRH